MAFQPAPVTGFETSPRISAVGEHRADGERLCHGVERGEVLLPRLDDGPGAGSTWLMRLLLLLTPASASCARVGGTL